MSAEISVWIQIVCLPLTNQRRLCRRRDIRCSTKDQMYRVGDCSVLTYKCDTSTMKIEDMCRFLAFDYRNPCSIGRKSWKKRIISNGARYIVLIKYGRSEEQVVNFHRLRRLEMYCVSLTTVCLIALCWLGQDGRKQRPNQNITSVDETRDHQSKPYRQTQATWLWST